MSAPAAAHYDARLGYQTLDARRYERRRYGGVVRWMNLRLLERALGRALAEVPPGSVVLDAPCGTGILTGFLRARGLRVIGADISPAMLGVARERGGTVGHVRADLEAPPWRPASFAAVVSSRFLMHLPPAIRPRVLAGLAALAHRPPPVYREELRPRAAPRPRAYRQAEPAPHARGAGPRGSARRARARAHRPGAPAALGGVGGGAPQSRGHEELRCRPSSASTRARSSTRAAFPPSRRRWCSPGARRGAPRCPRGRRRASARRSSCATATHAATAARACCARWRT